MDGHTTIYRGEHDERLILFRTDEEGGDMNYCEEGKENFKATLEAKDREIAELRAENKRLNERDGRAKISICLPKEDSPFYRVDAKICDFGVADNGYVVESEEINKDIAELKAALSLLINFIPECLEMPLGFNQVVARAKQALKGKS